MAKMHAHNNLSYFIVPLCLPFKLKQLLFLFLLVSTKPPENQAGEINTVLRPYVLHVFFFSNQMRNVKR